MINTKRVEIVAGFSSQKTSPLGYIGRVFYKFISCISSIMSRPVDSMVQLDADEDDSVNCISQLPSEIIIRILSKLSLRDRKNTRLVCRQWLTLNNLTEFSREEKLSCYGFYDLDVIVRTLENSSRKVLNLEFYNVKFEDFSWSQTFWMKCGTRIEWLLFRNCALSRDTMKSVLQHCRRLEYLSLEDLPAVSDKGVYPKITCFEGIDDSLSAESLRSFKLNITSVAQMPIDFLRTPLENFPNVKEFSFRCVEPIEDDDFFCADEGGVLEVSDKQCTFMDFGRLLERRMNELESIVFEEEDPRDLLVATSLLHILPLYYPKLKNVRVGLGLFSATSHPKLDFFMRHVNLLTVDCLLHFCSEVPSSVAAAYATKLITCLLDSCPSLQNLKLFQCQEEYGSGIKYVSLDTTASAKLVKSRMKSLNFNFNLELEFPSNGGEVINEDLKSLEISAPLRRESFLLLSKTFRALTHLMVVYMDDESLQSIWQYQKNLTSLQLINFQNCTDYGFLGRHSDVDEENNNQSKNSSIRALKKLKCLELSMCSCHDSHAPKISEKTFQGLALPNVQYLSVAINASWELSTTLVKACSNFVKLEGLNFAFYKEKSMDFSVWLELCGQLPHLKYISIQFDEFENFGDMNYERLFERCPNLRVLRTRDQSYYYDTVKWRLAKKCTSPSYRFCSKTIGNFSFDWMWF